MPAKKGRHRAVLATVLTIALALPLLPVALAEGPSLHIGVPVDGSSTTSPDIVVSGTSTPDQHRVTLDRTVLGTQPGMNMAWDPTGLVMRPVLHFQEGFTCSTLDLSKWVVVTDTGYIGIQEGALVIAWDGYYDPAGLVRSVRDLFPSDVDWTGEFSMMLSSQYVYYIQGGGGISGNALSPGGSTMAVDSKTEYWNEPNTHVYARGAPVFNFSNDGAYHAYTLEYTKATNLYSVVFDDTRLATFSAIDAPSHFWFGLYNPGTIYSYYTQIKVNYADIWTTRGTWASSTYDLGHQAVLDTANVKYTTSNPAAAKVALEARISTDNSTWSSWTPIGPQGSDPPLAGRYVQTRLATSLPKVRSETAHITVSSIDLDYHFPLVSVEVRREGGDWVTATGLERWSAPLTLQEDENTIEVRATDTSGASTSTSMKHILDTTRPTGTVEILSTGPYTNDLNVTLKLDASDRWGISHVQVSSAPDMYNMRTFPYRSTIPWRLDGIDGTVPVYVRFVDQNGLVSDVVSDSIIVDTFPPIGHVIIAKGASYTPTTTVRLDLEYSDSYGVAKVELANRPDFSDSVPLRGTSKVVEGYELLSGGDGTRTVYMRVTDVSGNVAILQDSIVLHWPKAVGAITIEGGVQVTSKSVVTVRIDCPPELRATRMELSNDVAFATSVVDTYQRDFLWILSPGDGHKTVYVRFEDFRGIWTLPVSSAIMLDTTPPVVTVVLAGGARYTTEENLTATVAVDDVSTPVRMWPSKDGRSDLVTPMAFTTTLQWTVPAWEADHFLHVQVEDAAGNLGTGVGSIHFATIRPQLTLELPDGPVSNAEGALAVTAKVLDPYGGIVVQLAFGKDPAADAPWHPAGYALSVAVPRDTPDGTFQVRGRARNAAGLVSDVSWVSVTLDREAPEVNLYEPPEGSSFRQKGLGIQVRFTADDPNGISVVSYRSNGDNWTSLPAEDRQAAVMFEDFGEHTITVRVVDGAGNGATASSTFSIEEAGAVVAGGGGGGLLGIMLIVLVVVVVGVVAQRAWLSRRRRASSASSEGPGREATSSEEGLASGPRPSPTFPGATASEPPVLPPVPVPSVPPYAGTALEHVDTGPVPDGAGATSGPTAPPPSDTPGPTAPRKGPTDWEEF